MKNCKSLYTIAIVSFLLALTLTSNFRIANNNQAITELINNKAFSLASRKVVSWQDVLVITNTEDFFASKISSKIVVELSDNCVEIIVGTKSTSNYEKSILKEITKSTNSIVINNIKPINAKVIRTPVTTLESLLNELNDLPFINYIEPNAITQIYSEPNDPYWSNQWGPERIDADLAWNLETGNLSNVLVAVIDTGIDYNHPDLANQYVPIGYDFVNNDSNPMDDHNHGTHCAGIIAATINNGIGIAGLANVSIMAIKAFDSDGYGTEAIAAESIIYAVNAGADILSNSYGSTDALTMHDACIYAAENDVLIIASAGNDNGEEYNYPASYPEVISVSAINEYDDFASYSTWGSTIELSAPGTNILSTIRVSSGSYGEKSGTSMAAPHVAGVAALMKSIQPNCSSEEIRQRLKYTAEDLGEQGWDKYFGFGLVNAYNAVLAMTEHNIVTTLNISTNVKINVETSIDIIITNYGFENESSVFTELYISNIKLTDYLIPEILVNESITFNYYWNPVKSGTINITAYTIPVSEEIDVNNNINSQYLNVLYPPQITNFTDLSGLEIKGTVLIQWYAIDIDSVLLNYHLYYSPNNGLTWYVITNQSESYYYWNTLELADGTDYLFRISVSDGDYTTTNQTSGTFTIDNPDKPTINLNEPIPNEVSGSIEISWTCNDPDDEFLFTIYLYNSNESMMIVLEENITTNYFTFNSLLYQDKPNYKIMIEVFDGVYYKVISSSYFRINNYEEEPIVWFISSLDGAIIQGNFTIRWSAYDNDDDQLTFSIELWNGKEWVIIAENLTHYYFAWDTTSIKNGEDYLLKITATDGVYTVEIQTEEPFTIYNNNTENTGQILVPLFIMNFLSFAIIYYLQTGKKGNKK